MLQSLRVWQRQPSFAATALVALAIAIGANSTLFTVVNSLLLRPLPFDHTEQLVELSISGRSAPMEYFSEARSIDMAGAFLGWGFPVRREDGTRNMYGARVTAD